jgi:flagellar protein FlaG
VEIRRIDNVVELAAVNPVTPLSPEMRAEQAQLVRAVEAVNEARLFGENSELTFSLDRETRRPVMKIVDRETQEVIRQIPPEYVLRLAEDLKG